jgi:hypothetical protein
MDNQEKHQQKKETEREEQKKVDKAHEEESQKYRLPINPIWMVLGVALTLLVVYFWTFGIW